MSYEFESEAPAIRVIPEASKFDDSLTTGEIVLESDDTNFPRAIDSLSEMASKHLALGYAARNGVRDPSLNGISTSVYPVNLEGKSLEDVKGDGGEALPPTHRLMRPARYRINIPIRSRMF